MGGSSTGWGITQSFFDLISAFLLESARQI
jgi:hypothetical protein